MRERRAEAGRVALPVRPAGSVVRLAGAVLLVLALAGCRAEEGPGAAGATASPAAADYFSCKRDGDCVIEPQRDCCPCNAGGKQVALREKAVGAYRAARSARCAGDLLCPQVYLCDEGAEAVCRAGRCEIRGAGQ